MAWYLAGGASHMRRLQKSSLSSSSFYLSRSIFSPLSSHTTTAAAVAAASTTTTFYQIPISNPNYSNTFTSTFEIFKFGWNFRSCTHISTSSVKEKNDDDDGDRSKVTAEVVVSSTSIDLYLLKHVQPYARLTRLDKPIGTWLLAWPSMWSISLVAIRGHLPNFKMMLLFGCGSLLLRGARYTINYILDCDIDTKAVSYDAIFHFMFVVGDSELEL